MKYFLKQLLGLLAELTDQNAYRRYLAAHHLEPSGESWRAFQDEHRQPKFRCC